MKIPLPQDVPNILTLANAVLVKHVADGANSVLPTFVDTAILDAQYHVAQTKQAQHESLFAQAKQHTEARDLAFGRHSSQSAGLSGTMLSYITQTLGILKAAHPDTPNAWSAWGFKVQTSARTIWMDATGKKVKKGTAGATEHHTKPAPRVLIPNNASEFIALANAIIAKHIADGAASPLANFVDMATLEAKTQAATTDHALSVQLHRDAEKACEDRDRAIWGTPKHRKNNVVGSLMHELSRAKNGLSAVFVNNLHRLGDWGFTVNATTPTTTPPTPTPPNGGGGNNPSNPA